MSVKYTTKPEVVEVIFFDGSNKAEVKALTGYPVMPEYMKDDDPDALLIVTDKGVNYRLCRDMYVVQYPSGQINVCGEIYFKSKFEELK